MSNQEFMINTSVIDLSSGTIGHVDLYCKDLYCANIKNSVISPDALALIPTAPLGSIGLIQPVLYDTINHKMVYSNSQPIRQVSVFMPGDDYTTFKLVVDSNNQPFNQSKWFFPLLCGFNNDSSPNANTTYAIRYQVNIDGNYTVNYYNNGSTGIGDSSLLLTMISRAFGGAISN